MKLIKFGTAGKMVCIGDDPKRGTWYKISDKVRPFLEKLHEGDEVSIRSEKHNSMEVLTHIQKGGNGVADVAPAPAPAAAVTSSSTGVNRVAKAVPSDTGVTSTPTKTYGKSAEEQDSIKRQATLHAMSRALICLQNQVLVEDICAVSTKIYAHFWDLVNGDVKK